MDNIKGQMEFVMSTYGYIINEDENGKKYVFNDLIECLDLTPALKSFVRYTFKENGVEIVDRVVEEIKEEDRSGKVEDFNFGEVKSSGLEAVDKPVLAKIVYDGEEVIFEDYGDLDDFIIEVFIPDNVRMKVNRSRNSKNEAKLDYDDEIHERLDYDDEPINPKDTYPSIRLSDIVKLKLSEKETLHVAELLHEQGIRIGGTSQDLDSVVTNYDYVRTYASKRFDKPLSAIEERVKFLEYYETRDPLLREELIVRNLRLVPYVAWKIALRHQVDIEELETYGYEGLILAIDKYDPMNNVKFATYAIPCISGSVLRAIPKLKRTPNNLYFDFQSACYIVEEEWGKKFDGDPKMLKDILDLMYARGMIKSEGQYRELEKYFSYKDGLPLEKLQEENFDIGNITMDDQLLGKAAFDEMKEELNRVLETLTPREQKVLSLRFGLLDGHQRTMEEVAKEFNVTRERIRQIEAKALRKLRHPMRSRKLKEFTGPNNDYAILNDNPTLYEGEEEKTI